MRFEISSSGEKKKRKEKKRKEKEKNKKKKEKKRKNSVDAVYIYIYIYCCSSPFPWCRASRFSLPLSLLLVERGERVRGNASIGRCRSSGLGRKSIHRPGWREPPTTRFEIEAVAGQTRTGSDLVSRGRTCRSTRLLEHKESRIFRFYDQLSILVPSYLNFPIFKNLFRRTPINYTIFLPFSLNIVLLRLF